MNPSQNQFWEEFNPQHSTDWIAQAEKEIKSPKKLADYTWISEEGIPWQPSYHAEDIQIPEIEWIQASQLVRHWTPSLPMARVSWHPRIGKELEEMYQRGVKAWYIVIEKEIPTALELQKSLEAFPWSKHPLFWETSQPDQLYRLLKSFMPYPLRGGILRILEDEEHAHWTRSWITGVPLARSGAHAVVELSYLLSQWQAGKGITVLEYSLQTNFFLDIAKGRALRYLAERLSKDNQQLMPYLFGSFNPYYLTHTSPSTNQLRCTTAAVAALVGGADAYWIPAWNDTPRLAYQIPLILEEEGYLNQVIDPAKGSYFIEHLTYSLIKAVDEHMQRLTGLEEMSYWQNLANENHQNRMARKPSLIGSTLYPSPEPAYAAWNFPSWPASFEVRSVETPED